MCFCGECHHDRSGLNCDLFDSGDFVHSFSVSIKNGVTGNLSFAFPHYCAYLTVFGGDNSRILVRCAGMIYFAFCVAICFGSSIGNKALCSIVPLNVHHITPLVVDNEIELRVIIKLLGITDSVAKFVDTTSS